MKDWTGKNVLIIGAARQGLAMARYLVSQGANVILNDQRSADQLHTAQQSIAGLKVNWILGGHPLEALDGVDLVCVSGGVSLEIPLLVEAHRRGLPLTNDSQVFMEAVPCKTIGITGSAGKTTTTTLVGRMLQAGMQAPRKVWVGGNIGQPLVGSLYEMGPDDLVVMELSSFQLELMDISPTYAAVLNLTPNHLDRHKTMPAYIAAKARILDYQKSSDMAVLGRDDPGAWGLKDRVKGTLASFGLAQSDLGELGTYFHDGEIWWTDGIHQEAILSSEVIQLRGIHNLLNVLAACAVVRSVGFPADCVKSGVQGFQGVAHRLELVRELDGVRWYNDSIATAPERTIAAIHSFTEPLVLLLGGRDKKLPWDNLASLIHERVDHLVLFGEASQMISKAVGPVRPGQRPYSIVICQGLQDAVDKAAEVAEVGDVILLSPGGTSFDEFTDFEERGERFTQWVKELS